MGGGTKALDGGVVEQIGTREMSPGAQTGQRPA